MNKIILGTSNRGKVMEIASILSPLGLDFEFKSMNIDETGSTIKENAIIKATAYSKDNPGCYIISEDSGLVVPKLNGLPGTYSARFYSIELDDKLNVIKVPVEKYTTDKSKIDRLNNERLLKLIKTIPFKDRNAYFEIAFVVMKDGITLFNNESYSYGYICDEMRGTNGFGYDPLFIGSDTFGSSYAELGTARKNLRSHRKKALRELGLWFSENLKK